VGAHTTRIEIEMKSRCPLANIECKQGPSTVVIPVPAPVWVSEISVGEQMWMARCGFRSARGPYGLPAAASVEALLCPAASIVNDGRRTRWRAMGRPGRHKLRRRGRTRRQGHNEANLDPPEISGSVQAFRRSLNIAARGSGQQLLHIYMNVSKHGPLPVTFLAMVLGDFRRCTSADYRNDDIHDPAGDRRWKPLINSLFMWGSQGLLA